MRTLGNGASFDAEEVTTGFFFEWVSTGFDGCGKGEHQHEEISEELHVCEEQMLCSLVNEDG